jgi:hypothetical protein
MRERSARKVGGALEAALRPVAEHLGLDYYQATIISPADGAQRAFEAIRIGTQALYGFTYADAWSERGFSRRDRARAAKIIARALARDEGRDAACFMACGLGGALAGTWRAGARDDPAHARELGAQAESSEGLVELVRAAWPISPDERLLGRVRSAARSRSFDPEASKAKFDLGPYVLKVQASAEALALAAAERFEAVEPLIIHPVMNVDVLFYAQLSNAWNLWARYWVNLLSRRPLPFSRVSDAVHAER